MGTTTRKMKQFIERSSYATGLFYGLTASLIVSTVD